MLSRISCSSPLIKRSLALTRRGSPTATCQYHRMLQHCSKKGNQLTNKSASKRIHSSAKSKSTFAPSSELLMAETVSSAPSRDQLKSLFVTAAVPMIGFGFMDNFIMIQAGGYIDATLGVTMGLATLTAAAMGQVISDVSGVLFGGTVERICEQLRIVKPSQLTQAQRALPLCRNVAMAGSVLGVIVGCMLGASSLLFVDLEAHDRQRRALELKDIVGSMVATEESFHGCTFYLTSSSSTNFDVSKACQETTTDAPQIRTLTDTHTMAKQCSERREMIGDDAHIYVPVMSRDGSTALGVLEFRKTLNPDDEKAGILVARHLAIFMERMD